MNVLVIDIGGSHVKLFATGAAQSRRFESSDALTAQDLIDRVRAETADWEYDVISVGFPGLIAAGAPAAEPGNLGDGWVGFNFAEAFDRPVRVVNDAVMQALGAYDGGRMLFLGLGTGLGSALVTEHVVIPLELGSLPSPRGATMAERVGRDALKHNGRDRWVRDVHDVTVVLGDALVAEYIVLGGGNAKFVDPLPLRTRRGGNEDAFTGGFRLWEEVVEPHAREPHRVWRVVQ
jgi:polyphosphate glucokinase